MLEETLLREPDRKSRQCGAGKGLLGSLPRPRAEKLRFFGGFLAFPGGKVSPADGEIPVTVVEPRIPAGPGFFHRYVAAARELFEETGVLLARQGDGSFPDAGPVLEELRGKLLSGQLPFQQVLGHLELTIQAADFLLLGRIVTSAFVPTRFDTVFLLCSGCRRTNPLRSGLANSTTASGHPRRRSWNAGTAGECLVSPPTVVILRRASNKRAAPEAGVTLRVYFATWEAGAIHPIYFSPQVQFIPLLTDSLPPSTHTNAYLVGREPAYLLDPGTILLRSNASVRRVGCFPADGGRLHGVVLTHHHPDHIGAANACAARYHVPFMPIR